MEAIKSLALEYPLEKTAKLWSEIAPKGKRKLWERIVKKHLEIHMRRGLENEGLEFFRRPK